MEEIEVKNELNKFNSLIKVGNINEVLSNFVKLKEKGWSLQMEYKESSMDSIKSCASLKNKELINDFEIINRANTQNLESLDLNEGMSLSYSLFI